ncbi:MAG: MBL fold metallo-hydrolase [Candidatus Binatia bacterium]|nr:MBL fold metallo-hydrolase [Candidatus Binatia bacterium]
MSAESRLYLKQVEVGPMQNYAYLVGDREKREAVLIDAAWDVDGLVDIAEKDDMKITAGLVTHFHPDHLGGSMMGMDITGAAELIARIPVKIHMHKSEGSYAQKVSGLSSSDIVLTEGGDDFNVGDIQIKFLHTPGHTPGSQCFLVDGNLVSGDTLFIGSCGRVDLPGSSPEDLWRSLTGTLKVLPEATILYPGHNYSDQMTSTIGDESRKNPYMRFGKLQDFLSMMGY